MSFFKLIPVSERRITIATWLTIMRMVAAPVLIVLIANEWWYAGFWCFVGAALTDVGDGALARVRNEQTTLGACLDPIADKIFIIACFFSLSYCPIPFMRVPGWFVTLIVLKEILLVFGVVLTYVRYDSVAIRPTMMSKITTMVQLCFIGWLFGCYFFQWAPLYVYNSILAMIVVMVLGSLVQYAQIGLKIREKV